MSSDKLLWELRSISAEILAMGHLLKHQQLETLPTEEVQIGLGKILERIGRRVRRLAIKMEESELKSMTSQ